MNQQSAKAAESKIVIQQGDLTEMETDAIVNAANNLIPTAGCMPGIWFGTAVRKMLPCAKSICCARCTRIALLVSQCHQWVDAHGAASGDVACGEGHEN